MATLFPPGSIGAIVQAAGGSTRMGRPKQLLAYQGRSLLRHSVEQALGAGCRPVIVVLGADADVCAREVAGLEVQVARNDRWAEGMGSSIRTGMTALQGVAPDARAAILMVCDQPLVTAAFLAELVARHLADDTGALAVAAGYDGQPGVPALFPRTRFADLARLDGAGGAKRLLQQPGGRTAIVPCPAAALDVDTPADYDALPRVTDAP